MLQTFLPDSAFKKVVISAGSNISDEISDATELLRKGLADLCFDLGTEVESSMHYRTPAFPSGSGPDYANAIFLAETNRTPEQILALLHQIEARAGRERNRRWEQRSLDLDLIAYADFIIPDQETWTHWRDLPLNRQVSEAPDQLILPHPRIQDRAFVLVPLAEVCPGWRHPITGKSASDMIAELPDADVASVTPLD